MTLLIMGGGIIAVGGAALLVKRYFTGPKEPTGSFVSEQTLKDIKIALGRQGDLGN